MWPTTSLMLHFPGAYRCVPRPAGTDRSNAAVVATSRSRVSKMLPWGTRLTYRP